MSSRFPSLLLILTNPMSQIMHSLRQVFTQLLNCVPESVSIGPSGVDVLLMSHEAVQLHHDGAHHHEGDGETGKHDRHDDGHVNIIVHQVQVGGDLRHRAEVQLGVGQVQRQVEAGCLHENFAPRNLKSFCHFKFK